MSNTAITNEAPETPAPTQIVLTEDEKLDKMIEDELNLHYYPESVIDCQDVRIFSTHVEIELNKVKKNISISEFKKIFDEMLLETSAAKTLALPYHCFLMAQSPSEISLSCYYPGTKQKLKFHSREISAEIKEYDVPMPNVVISHRLLSDGKGWKVAQSLYFCTDLPVTKLPDDVPIRVANPSKGIYKMPFPNFYPEGRMCYGGNTMPIKFNDNLRGLDYYYQVLMASPFNEDLGLGGLVKSWNTKDWFEHLAKLDTFKYSDLRKS